MKASDPWYLAKRAELLAIMMLTRNGKVAVSQSPQAEGLDLLATIVNGHPAGRIFGVEVKASSDIRTLVAKDGTVRKALAQQLTERLGEYPFPVGAMLFDMQTDDGYFVWILAPSIEVRTGSPTLRRSSPLRAEAVTDDLLRKVIQEIDDWYDAKTNHRRLAQKSTR